MELNKMAMRQILCAVLLSAASTCLVASELMIYPNEGQDDVQQDKDNYECYSWAKGESGFDPMAPPTATEPPPQQQAQYEQQQMAQYDAARSSYNRAFAACMEGRGYSVK